MSLKFSALSVSKCFFFIILLYSGWFQYAFFEVHKILLILGICMVGALLIFFYKKDSRILLPITSEYIWWFVFFMYSFISGIFIAANKTQLLNSVITGLEYLLIGYILFLIISQEKKLDFAVLVIIICSVLAAVTTMLYPVELPRDPGRYTMGLNNNANSLGIAMIIGIFCSLYMINFRNLLKDALLLVGIGLMVYTIFLTGSRKSLISLVLLLAVWIVFSARKLFKALPSEKRNRSILIFLIVALLVYLFISHSLERFALLTRMQSLVQNGMAESRENMYQTALSLFLSNPLVGIGYKQFEIISGFNMYSHSTYAETLCCTGLIGVLLYFIPYVIIICKLIKKVKTLYKIQQQHFAYIWIAMFALVLFLGTGMIHYYEISSNVVIGMMIAFANLNLENTFRTDETIRNRADCV